jgi:hypothetical protein
MARAPVLTRFALTTLRLSFVSLRSQPQTNYIILNKKVPFNKNGTFLLTYRKHSLSSWCIVAGQWL